MEELDEILNKKMPFKEREIKALEAIRKIFGAQKCIFSKNGIPSNNDFFFTITTNDESKRLIGYVIVIEPTKHIDNETGGKIYNKLNLIFDKINVEYREYMREYIDPETDFFNLKCFKKAKGQPNGYFVYDCIIGMKKLEYETPEKRKKMLSIFLEFYKEYSKGVTTAPFRLSDGEFAFVVDAKLHDKAETMLKNIKDWMETKNISMHYSCARSHYLPLQNVYLDAHENLMSQDEMRWYNNASHDNIKQNRP